MTAAAALDALSLEERLFCQFVGGFWRAALSDRQIPAPPACGPGRQVVLAGPCDQARARDWAQRVGPRWRGLSPSARLRLLIRARAAGPDPLALTLDGLSAEAAADRAARLREAWDAGLARPDAAAPCGAEDTDLVRALAARLMAGACVILSPGCDRPGLGLALGLWLEACDLPAGVFAMLQAAGAQDLWSG